MTTAEKRQAAYNRFNVTIKSIRTQRETEDRAYVRCVSAGDAVAQHDPYTEMEILAQKTLNRELAGIEAEAAKSVPKDRFSWKRAKELMRAFYGDGTLDVYGLMEKAVSRRDKGQMRKAVEYGMYEAFLPPRFQEELEGVLEELDGMLASAGA